MNRLLVGRVSSLGLLMVVVVLALSACGGDEKKAKARPLPEEPKALHPGTYRSEEFKPSLSFHVGKGWSSSPFQEASDGLGIARGQTAGLGFFNVQEVYKPTTTGSAILVDAPKNIAGWLQQHPYLQTSNPEPVTVGGVKGVEFDVVVGDLPKGYNPTCSSIVGDPKCVDLFRLSTGGPVFVAKGEKVHVIVLEDVEGETVTIGFVSRASEFGEFAPEAQKVLDSVEWRGS
jgi:type IV secretory pathway protease TraF